MMFVGNTCLSELIFASNLLGMFVFTLKNDLQQIQLQDSLCNIRGYINYVSYGAFNYSFVLQAFYRYVIVVYPTRLFWKSARNQSALICLTWMLAFVQVIPLIPIGGVVYNVQNQICQIPLRFSFSIIYLASCVYLIPTSILMFIYFKLVRYVRQASERAATPANILVRAQRELKMVRRTVILVIILLTLGVPYCTFILLSFFTNVYEYHFRIAFLFADVSLVFVMITLFQFTDPLKASLNKLVNKRPNMVMATVA